MGKLTLYGTDISPPVRAVLLTLKALKLPYDFVEINLFEKEHLKPEYLKKNPQHTVPTLEDDGHYICDSHAINAYLVEKYAESDDLYPKHLTERIPIIERLHFESQDLYCNVYRRIFRPILLENTKVLPSESLDVYRLVDGFLQDQLYVAGHTLTIADFSFISSVTSLIALFPICETQYKRLWEWVRRMQKLPFYEEANGKGASQLAAIIKSKNIVFDKKQRIQYT